LSENASDMRSTYQPRPAPPSSSSRGLPPPAPPTIMDPLPARSNSFLRPHAPHEPFLCDAPPPPDSWITVETSPVEYRLVARLPGFGRDAITLAARRRRVLHVVADSWEPGGGHFERRISFGYDADLSHVRAEFDGEILRVIVPRRTPPITWYGGACE
jgi:HSP20 family molecular chaperone IbpA